jgi:hypothetical protein
VIPAARMLLMAVERRIIGDGDRFKTKAGIILYADDAGFVSISFSRNQ